MVVLNVESSQEFANLIATESSAKLVVVDFYATWCGPCQAIKPVFLQLSNKYSTAQFVQVDVDKLKDVAQACGITAMPTFQLFKGQKKVAEIKGAKASDLEQLIQKHSVDSSIGAASSVDNDAPAGYKNITSLVAVNQLDCLNKKDEQQSKNLFASAGGLIESDVDDQLLMWIPFAQNVRLHSLLIKAPSGILLESALILENGPKTIKVFVNLPSPLGFDDMDSSVPTEEILINADTLSGQKLIPLKFVKYQNVHNVQIFVQDNQSNSEVTTIQQIKFFGLPIDTTNMSDFNKDSKE